MTKRRNKRNERFASTVQFVPIEKLKTSYAALRPGALPPCCDLTATMPIRVVPTEDGAYEVIDGFKRLNDWREQGYQSVPVAIEAQCRVEEQKRLLLLAKG